MADQKSLDKQYLLTALELAKKGEYTTKPNPRVGCVLVKNEKILGKGWHIRAGEGHAEVNAIADAIKQGYELKGATAYVSLEPCSFTGKTPPCIHALAEAGIKRMVCASIDPNPNVAGLGIAKLNEIGIDASVVEDDAILAKAEWLNRGFFKRMRTNMPWVMLKTAATLDGKTADKDGNSQWITSEAARQDVQRLRAASDAILTGSGTLLADNPRLNARVDDAVKQPLRVLLDSQFQLKPDAQILLDNNLVVFTTVPAPDWANDFSVIQTDKIQLSAVLSYLAEQGLNTVMIEAGATLAGAFLEQGLIDECVHYVAPAILGEQSKGMFLSSEPLNFEERIQFRLRSVEQIGTDVKLTLINQQYTF